MTTVHPDSHDLDKLARWQQSLSSGEPGEFPVHAVFLVSGHDKLAHDIFRSFRSSFESRSASFHHLIIFGQHGTSSTVRELLTVLGLPAASLPVLVLFSTSSSTEICLHSLPIGIESDDSAWEDVLRSVEEVADDGRQLSDLSSLPGVACRQLKSGPLVDIIGNVLGAIL